MLSYSLPESYPHESVILHNMVVAVMVTGGQATSAQSKPMATFSKEKQRVTWRFSEPLELRRGQVQRLLCQFTTLSAAHEAPGGIEVRFSSTTTPPSVRLDLDRNGKYVAVPANNALFVNRYTATSQ